MMRSLYRVQSFLTLLQRIASTATFDRVFQKLRLGEAAKRAVGTGANQIPDMGMFSSSLSQMAGWQKFPSGLMIQYSRSGGTNIEKPITFPVAFPNAVLSVAFGNRQSSFPSMGQSVVIDDSTVNRFGFTCRAYAFDKASMIDSSSNFFWMAIGY
ncbi:gp53-like domain-containing protein [Escherichia coli]